MKKLFFLMMIIFTLTTSVFALQNGVTVKSKQLTVTAQNDGLHITKKHSSKFTRITIHIKTDEGENFAINTDEKTNQFIYPFVSAGKTYKVYLEMMDKNYGNWTQTQSVEITAQGGLGDCRITCSDAFYDSQNCQLVLNNYDFVKPEAEGIILNYFSGNVYTKFINGQIDYSSSGWGTFSFSEENSQGKIDLSSIFGQIFQKDFALQIMTYFDYKGINYRAIVFENQKNPFKDNHIIKNLEISQGLLKPLYHPAVYDYELLAIPENLEIKVQFADKIQTYNLDFTKQNRQKIIINSQEQNLTLNFTRVKSKEFTFQDKKYGEIFYDDFDGTDLDPSKWRRSPQQERQTKMQNHGWWADECSYVQNGNLVIENKISGDKLISGSVESYGLFEYSQALYEIKFKMNKSSGLWYAFWLMGHNDDSHIGNGAVDGAELDCFELIPNESNSGKNLFKTSVHWDGYGSAHKSQGSDSLFPSDDFFDQWHILQFVWGKTSYDVYLDGKLLWVLDASKNDLEHFGGMCNQKNWMIISSEFGDWGGSLKKDMLPARMYVDYVRVGSEIN